MKTLSKEIKAIYGKNSFVKIKNDAFAIEKVQFAFVKTESGASTENGDFFLISENPFPFAGMLNLVFCLKMQMLQKTKPLNLGKNMLPQSEPIRAVHRKQNHREEMVRL